MKITLPKGSKLFHGSLEAFEGALSPGVDGLVWFADSPSIAQLYIPRSGLSVLASSSHIARPNSDRTIQAIQRMIGLNYDYSKVEWQPGGQRAQSYYMPEDDPTWAEASGASSRAYKRWSEIEKEMKDLNARSQQAWDDFRRESKAVRKTQGWDSDPPALKKLEAEWDRTVKANVDRYDELEAELEEVKQAVSDASNAMEKEVERRLDELGYETYGSYNPPGGKSYRFHSSGDVLLPPGGAAEGRLFACETTKPLTLWGKAVGESDLTNTQYTDYAGFAEAEEAGFDGVLIDDFAQSEEWGNLQHLSVGLFQHAIQHVKCIQVLATYEEFSFGGKTKAWPQGSESYFTSLLTRDLKTRLLR